MKSCNLIPNKQISEMGIRMTNITDGIIRPKIFCIVSFFMRTKVIHIFHYTSNVTFKFHGRGSNIQKTLNMKIKALHETLLFIYSAVLCIN